MMRGWNYNCNIATKKTNKNKTLECQTTNTACQQARVLKFSITLFTGQGHVVLFIGGGEGHE